MIILDGDTFLTYLAWSLVSQLAMVVVDVLEPWLAWT